ncbi:MAG TPA: hypothetical protein VHF05_02575 [Candidatus Paceibacterota bacterium]|nr:hypothetical protein [Candidatus Paceibacterota bacterium]
MEKLAVALGKHEEHAKALAEATEKIADLEQMREERRWINEVVDRLKASVKENVTAHIMPLVVRGGYNSPYVDYTGPYVEVSFEDKFGARQPVLQIGFDFCETGAEIWVWEHPDDCSKRCATFPYADQQAIEYVCDYAKSLDLWRISADDLKNDQGVHLPGGMVVE